MSCGWDYIPCKAVACSGRCSDGMLGRLNFCLNIFVVRSLTPSSAADVGDFTPLQWVVHRFLYGVADGMYENVKPANEEDRKKSFNIVALLLANGVNVNAHDRHGDAPLHHAVHFLHKPRTELLLQHNAYVNTRNSVGETVLHVIARVARGYRGRAELTEFLLNEGASYSIKNKTAFNIAIAC